MTRTLSSRACSGAETRSKFGSRGRPKGYVVHESPPDGRTRRGLGQAEIPAEISATPEDSLQLAARYALASEFVALQSVPRTVPSDPDDDAVIATGIAAGADLIVSGDGDLLALHPYRGMRILNAADAVRHMRVALDK